MDLNWLSLGYIFVATLIGETFGTMFGGGSFFIQPALLAAKIPANLAVANDVTSAVFSSLAFVWFYRKQGEKVDYRPLKPIVLWMAPAMIVGAVVGGHVLQALPEHVLKWIIVGICLCGFVYTLTRISKKDAGKSGGAGLTFMPYWQGAAVLAGLGLGLYDGVSGAGGGILLILLLTMIFRMDMKMVVVLANLLSMISLGAAGVTFFFLGLLEPVLLLVMVPACVLAGLAGARVAELLPEKALRMIYALLVLALMGYLVFSMAG